MKQNHRKRIVATLTLLGALSFISCQRPSSPNVLLVTLDTTRADRIGAYGHAKAATPNLDALAARGATFERAFASAPMTLPSHVTLLTGLDPNQHRVHDNGGFIAPPSLETLAELLHARGYRAGAFVSSVVLDREFGLDQGFDVYDDETDRDYGQLSFLHARREAKQTTDRALAWLRQSASGPHFAWVHYYDVHLPRHAPPPFDRIGNRYDGSLAYVDSEIGRLLAGADQAGGGRETLIIAVGDHGEGLGDHDEMAHGLVAYDSTLRVPLIVAGPGFGGNERSKAFVKTADVTPTVLLAVGAPPAANSSGRPLQQRLAEKADTEVAYFETHFPAQAYGWSVVGGVRTERWKLTAEPKPVELYDTLADPGELEDVAANQPAVVEELTKSYEKLRPAEIADAGAVDPDVAQKLAALGYVAQAQRFDPDKRPDPRAMVSAVTLIERAETIAWQGRIADAIEALRLFTANEVIRPVALGILGPIYFRTQRYEDAVKTYRDLADLTGNVNVRLQLAEVLTMADRAGEALVVLDQVAAASESTKPPSNLALIRARALLAANKPEEAIRETTKLLADDPWNDGVLTLDSNARASQDEGAAIAKLEDALKKAPEPQRLVHARGLLATLLHRHGRNQEARALLESATGKPPQQRALLAEITLADGDAKKAATLYEELVADLPGAAGYARRLASVYSGLGRNEEALPLYEKILQLNPNDAFAYVGRGTVLARLRRVADAEADFRKALSIDAGRSEAAFRLSSLLLAKGDDREAEKWSRQVVDARPDHAGAHRILSEIYRKRGDSRAADHEAKAAALAKKGRSASVTPLPEPPG